MRHYKRKSLAVALLLLIYLGALGPIRPSVVGQGLMRSGRRASVAAERWYTFTSPDSDFTLMFPGLPARIEGGESSIPPVRQYSLTNSSQVRLSIAFLDTGGSPRSPENNRVNPAFLQAKVRLARERGEIVAQARRLTGNMYEIERWMPISGSSVPIHLLERGILRRNRVYILTCGALLDAREVDRAVCQRFFNSFRLLREP